MVADQGADFVQSRGDGCAVCHHLDFSVIVAEVARLGSGPEIDPFAEIAVAEKAIVILVGVPLNDARFHFAADPAIWTDGCAGTKLRPEEMSPRANHAGPFQARE